MAMSMDPAGFHFLRPLWLLVLVPLWALIWFQTRRRARQGNWATLIDRDLLEGLRLPADAPHAASSPLPWLALAWTLAGLALAGPTWQRDVTHGFRAAASWIIVLDLSPSMTARDVSPDRVTRARYAIDDLLGSARDARVGLVAFSDDAYTVAPLTEDVATVRSLLTPLVPSLMPVPGDNLAPALDRAGKLLTASAAKEQRVIVLTDGFADPAASLAAADRLRVRGVALDVVGIGTEVGAPLGDAGGGFARDAGGETQVVRLDVDRLRHLAAAGGGEYRGLEDLSRLAARLESRPALSSSTAEHDVQIDHWRDAGVWLLPLLIVLAATLTRRGWL